MRSYSFEERRLYIDQGHRLIANVSAVIAEQTGAIGFFWRHVHQLNYDGRPEHEERDKKFYVIRDSWAMQRGLMKRGPNPYSDEIDMPAQKIFCRCWAEYADSLKDVPDENLTEKGREAKSL